MKSYSLHSCNVVQFLGNWINYSITNVSVTYSTLEISEIVFLFNIFNNGLLCISFMSLISMFYLYTIILHIYPIMCCHVNFIWYVVASMMNMKLTWQHIIGWMFKIIVHRQSILIKFFFHSKSLVVLVFYFCFKISCFRISR